RIYPARWITRDRIGIFIPAGKWAFYTGQRLVNSVTRPSRPISRAPSEMIDSKSQPAGVPRRRAGAFRPTNSSKVVLAAGFDLQTRLAVILFLVIGIRKAWDLALSMARQSRA